MRLFTCAVVVTAALALSGCLAASVAGTAIGVTGKVAGATIHGAGMVAGAVIP